MSSMELNAELFRQLSIIAEDETLMRKAVKAIRKLAQKKEEENGYRVYQQGRNLGRNCMRAERCEGWKNNPSS